jgi:hypothetical protein
VALDAGNLAPVAEALRKELPDVQIVVCADDDWKTEGNPGLTKAKEAAAAVGGIVAVPVFGEGRVDKWTDFHDLANAQGLPAVKAIIDVAIQAFSFPDGTDGTSSASKASGGSVTKNPDGTAETRVDIDGSVTKVECTGKKRRWAMELGVNADLFHDDRRTCEQCANLAGQRCQAAVRGELAGGADLPTKPRATSMAWGHTEK